MYKYRAEITKDESIRYISHLDYAATIERAICRAKLPAAYSEGFNPHMKLAFASALAVGITSAAEYMDFELRECLPASEVARRIDTSLPEGIRVRKIRFIEGKAKALMSEADLAVYSVFLKLTGEFEQAKKAISDFNSAEEVIFERITPKKTREIEIKQYIKDEVTLSVVEKQVKLSISIIVTPTGSVKPGEVVKTLCGKFSFPSKADGALIYREKLLGHGKALIELD